jgi:pimeloyl-ACP methyl ester carboxylesterase
MLFGFRKGRARRAGPLVRLMNTTTAARDYCELAGMTLDKIDQVQHSTLLLYGEESVFLDTYQYLRDHLTNSVSFLLPHSEHFGPMERPGLLLQHVRAFFAESEGPAQTRTASSSEYST